MDDPRHSYTCDWNLYSEQRPDPELCNLGCLDDPEMVKRDRAYLDAKAVAAERPFSIQPGFRWTAHIDGSGCGS